jgi:hypothetical protein
MSPNRDQVTRSRAALRVKPFLRPLVRRQLAIGGDCVVCWNADAVTGENFTSLLVQYGETRDGARAILKRGKRNRCHYNAIDLAASYPARYECHMGYALSSDSLWRSHCFLVHRKTGKIVETTVRRKKYFSVGFPSELVKVLANREAVQ